MADKRQKGVQNGVGCISGLCISLKGIFKMSEHLLQNFLPFVLSPNSCTWNPCFPGANPVISPVTFTDES